MWTSDLNYARTKAEYRRRHYLEQLRNALPDTAEFREF